MEALFDMFECPPASMGWCYCDRCTAAWQMWRKDATLCPSCGSNEVRELTMQEMKAVVYSAMGQPDIIKFLVGESVQSNLAEAFQNLARALHLLLPAETGE